MKAFTFRLETLLHLREIARDRAMKNYALAIKKREQSELELQNGIEELSNLNADVRSKRAIGFVGHDQDVFNQSIQRAKQNIIDLNSKVANSKNIELAKRSTYLKTDSNCKSLVKLKEKKKSEHLKAEEKKDESELEDIIGARFVYNQKV